VQPNFLAPTGQSPVWAGEAAAIAGTALGIWVDSASLDFELTDLTVAYRSTAPLFDRAHVMVSPVPPHERGEAEPQGL
jgi:hypothetical protein